MNPLARSFILTAAVWSASSWTVPILAQGMPKEARDDIHVLFNRRDRVERTVEKTASGYIAVTTASDPAVAAALKSHVKQMSERLESGLMVRRWDPAFAEYVRHYKNIDHKFEPIEQGIRVVVNGKTPEAVKAAQNHATIITSFVNDGWEAHDRAHPAANETEIDPAPKAVSPAPTKECCGGGPRSKICREKGNLPVE